MSNQDYSYPMLMIKSAHKAAEDALLRKDYSDATMQLVDVIRHAAEAIRAVEDIRDQ